MPSLNAPSFVSALTLMLAPALGCSDAPAGAPMTDRGSAGSSNAGGAGSAIAAGGSAGSGGSPAAGGSVAGQSGAGGSSALLPYGLDARPANPTCLAPARPDAPAPAAFPSTLSATGCFEPQQPSKPLAGVIPFEVNAPLWSDGAKKQRWFALPDGAKIEIGSDGDFDLPIGSVLIKQFMLQDKPIETRLLVRHADGDWAGYSYAWRDDGSDADLLPSTLRKTFGDQEWTYPSREDCLLCHMKAAGRSLSLETAQLNRVAPYALGQADQLATFEHIGLFTTPPSASTPAFPEPTSSSGTLSDRARAYLHSNCSNCHRPGGVSEVSIDLRFGTPLAETKVCDAAPAKGNFGFLGAKLLTPGDPTSSLVSIRMHSAVAGVLMPQIGRARTDDLGVAVIDDFITQLTGCQ
jgi:uncharacterized repeat protein (TIGR03806 family)